MKQQKDFPLSRLNSRWRELKDSSAQRIFWVWTQKDELYFCWCFTFCWRCFDDVNRLFLVDDVRVLVRYYNYFLWRLVWHTALQAWPFRKYIGIWKGGGGGFWRCACDETTLIFCLIFYKESVFVEKYSEVQVIKSTRVSEFHTIENNTKLVYLLGIVVGNSIKTNKVCPEPSETSLPKLSSVADLCKAVRLCFLQA